MKTKNLERLHINVNPGGEGATALPTDFNQKPVFLEKTGF